MAVFKEALAACSSGVATLPVTDGLRPATVATEQSPGAASSGDGAQYAVNPDEEATPCCTSPDFEMRGCTSKRKILAHPTRDDRKPLGGLRLAIAYTGICRGSYWSQLMSFGLGICPHCGTENSVFRGVRSPMLRTPNELAKGASEGCDPAAHLVFWVCWHCDRQFQTEVMLHGVSRSEA
jgi:hypothetical protein